MYLDPGSGSVILQVIIAAVLGIGVFLRLFAGKIRSWFGKGPASDPGADDDQPKVE
jgi:hypothetical protein